MLESPKSSREIDRERLTAVTHYFGRAVQARALEAPAVADGLIVALEVTLHTIHDRARIPAEA